MSLSYAIDVSGDAEVLRLMERLRSHLADRTELHKSVGSHAEILTAQHLSVLAGTRHATADRLGASPSGHLARAAESVTSEGTDAAALVSVTSPGIRRAFGDVTIKPKSGKYLTIPATAEAYNRRARSFNDLRIAIFGGKLALVQAEQSSLADRSRSGFSYENRAPMQSAGRAPIYYWLKDKVTQKQDRSLLPSDAEYSTAAVMGIKAYIRLLRAAASA